MIVHGGATMVQLYCGQSSSYTKGHPLTKEHSMFHTLEDLIQDVGAPTTHFSDNSKAQPSRNVEEILCFYIVGNFQVEPHHQHQNPAERKIQDVKHLTSSLMDGAGTPTRYCLLCLLFSIHLLNHLATESLMWETPIEAAIGQKPDISAFLQFRW
jgi:hypothetical protein